MAEPEANHPTTVGVDHVKVGLIELIFGPMFSGKTTELIRRVNRFMIAKKTCVVIKYIKDTRYSDDNFISTHNYLKLPALPCGEHLNSIYDKIKNYDCIGIDEGQFFSDIVEFTSKLADKKGKIVIVSALDGTFKRKPFGNVLDLIPLAENVAKLHAICSICCDEAPFSKRIGLETEIEVIGGSEKYEARCRKCFNL